MEILNLQDYINKAAWLIESGSYKRIDFILGLRLTKEDYKEFKSLISMFNYDDLYKNFDHRIEFKIYPFSSKASEHIVKIDGETYYLVGNEEQFMSQFTFEIREKRLRDLLDKKDDK
ncbi:MAG: hypothetical protein SLAVMIC_00306 [uncultured marine phage]|uniref:Uncharacterized protein n=1 Tax=uncultured marine phage TaxID=707152 RepID=A0A8D9CEY6_9VIRU|nr:MAG: hypothetical protein SLAVMIC_00306 [uncultured marine phage]